MSSIASQPMNELSSYVTFCKLFYFKFVSQLKQCLVVLDKGRVVKYCKTVAGDVAVANVHIRPHKYTITNLS